MEWQKKIALYGLALLISSTSFSSTKTPMIQFESSEHVAAGSHVKLYFSSQDTGTTDPELLLPNGLQITYGQLVSLGDFYGIVGRPISVGITDIDRQSRFLAAFDTFARDPNAVSEMPKILEIVQSEQQAIDDGIKKGEKPEDVYARISDDDNRQWNCVTGGGCDAKTWVVKPGRYLNLAKQDFDHFGDNAWSAYQTGHELAIKTAIEAHQTQDLKKLSLAYTLNGFACHFLSDRFASGHIRSPRIELTTNVTPSVVGSLLVHFMHDEENSYGLHMHNLRGDHWISFGDEYYYNKNNKANVDLMQEALQISSDEVFAAYQQGTYAPDQVKNLIPIPDETANKGSIDIAPLFYWDAPAKTLYRRTDTANPLDRHWTSNWWGWSTFILLSRQHGLPATSQAELVLKGFSPQAIEYGLITDETVLSYAKQQMKYSK